MKAVLLCLLLCFSLSLSQRTIQFDPAQEQNCVVDGCSFYDPSIWITNTVPSLSTDIVIISGSTAQSDLFIYFPNNTVSLYSITLSNASLSLQTSATLQVTIFNFGDNSKFNTEVNSTFLVDPQGTSRSVSVLNMNMQYQSSWDINGYVLVNTAVYLLGDITVDESADVFLANVFYYPSTISTTYPNFHMKTVNIPHYATVSFDDGLVAFFLNVSYNATVNFNDNVNISQIYIGGNSTVNFIDATVFLGPSAYIAPYFNQSSLSSFPVGPEVLPPLTGDVTSQVVSSSSSAISILGESPFTYAGSFSTDSLSTFYFKNVQLSFSNLIMAVVVADGFTFNGTLTTMKQLTVLGNGITFSGSLWISSPAFVNTTINVLEGSYNQLVLGTDYNITYGPNAALNVGGIISGQNVFIPSWASLVATSVNTSIQVTNLFMDGTLDASKGNRIIMGGNLILGPQSNLLATLRTEFDAPVFVIGNIVLNGNASYSLTKVPHSNKKYALIETLGNLGSPQYTMTGRFISEKAKALHESAVDRNLALTYTSDTVFVKYDLSVKDIPTWIWIVGGIAVVAVIALIIAIIAICAMKRRRHDYKPVR